MSLKATCGQTFQLRHKIVNVCYKKGLVLINKNKQWHDKSVLSVMALSQQLSQGCMGRIIDSYDMMVAIYISNRLHVNPSTIKQEEI